MAVGQCLSRGLAAPLLPLQAAVATSSVLVRCDAAAELVAFAASTLRVVVNCIVSVASPLPGPRQRSPLAPQWFPPPPLSKMTRATPMVSTASAASDLTGSWLAARRPLGPHCLVGHPGPSGCLCSYASCQCRCSRIECTAVPQQDSLQWWLLPSPRASTDRPSPSAPQRSRRHDLADSRRGLSSPPSAICSTARVASELEGGSATSTASRPRALLNGSEALVAPPSLACHLGASRT